MNITEAHKQLNEWYPGCSHHIGISLWQWGHMNNELELKYEVSVHRTGDCLVASSYNSPSLEKAILQVAPKPEISASATLDAADKTQEEVESLVSKV